MAESRCGRPRPMASLAASMLAGHIGLAFDLGLGVNASAGARRPCQLRGAWLQTRSGRRVQELLATPPIESGVSRDESGALDEGGARDTLISAKRRAASLALALAIGGGKRREERAREERVQMSRHVCARSKGSAGREYFRGGELSRSNFLTKKTQF